MRAKVPRGSVTTRIRGRERFEFSKTLSGLTAIEEPAFTVESIYIIYCWAGNIGYGIYWIADMQDMSDIGAAIN
jgi:hypothetical protein